VAVASLKSIFLNDVLTSWWCCSVPPWYAPWFLGDGVGEDSLDPQFHDAKGNTVLDVPDYFVSVNKTDPAP